MKSRLSYFLILGIIILSIFTGIFIWRNNHLKRIPKSIGQSFNAPSSSKYIPRNTDLIFHWKLNPDTLTSHIENYQDKVSKHTINKKISFIRDSSFKLISLDFAKDISKWVGDYGSFALLDSNNKTLNDWIMVLAIKEDVNIEKELESILGSQLIDNSYKISNKISSSTAQIISKKINSTNSIYFANDKDNILIASNPQIIKSSMEKIDSNILDAKKEYKNIQLKDNLKDGLLLLEVSPKKILNLIGQEENLFEINEIDNLISSANLDKNNLYIEGIVNYDVKTKMPVKDINYNFIEIQKESELHKDLILVDNPNQYFREDSSHPYQKLIASLIKESTTYDNSTLFKKILDNSKGNLIWINDKEWLVINSKTDASKIEISEILKKENFLHSNIDFKNRKLEVWSKISANENEKYELKENIEAIIQEDEENYIWSQNLSSISNFDKKNYLKNYSDNENKVDELNDFDDVLKIHLGEEKTKRILNNFYPYILFKTMLGNELSPPKSIDISIAVPTINYPDFIKVKINLKTSS
ncbi:DUF3352 domain-containing protein [Prochlorococcus marinus]|uniref:DUF3352 domain-containing protein n=1 Tax=Prochlorococcus marinus TaxID=1219 RepID=UPI0022B386E6|nr:DUF3352 domain-containing protein [Prochlorococcus marinus]